MTVSNYQRLFKFKMGSSFNHLLTLSLFSLFFPHNLIGMAKSDESLINTLCSKTDEPVLSKECLQSDPKSKTADEQGLALIAIGRAERDTTFLHKDTFNLLQKATGKLKGVLDDCAQQSFLAQEDFPPVARYVQQRHYDSAKDVIEKKSSLL